MSATVIEVDKNFIARLAGKQEPSQFRNLVRQVSGKEITSVQAEQFLSIFEEDLNVEILEAKRRFIARHFGSKRGTNGMGPGA